MLGISCHALEVVPGAEYELFYDFLLPEENAPSYLRLRCVGNANAGEESGQGPETLFNLYSRKKHKYWQPVEHIFTVPEGMNSITLYFVVGPGRGGDTAYVDKVNMTRVEKPTTAEKR